MRNDHRTVLAVALWLILVFVLPGTSVAALLIGVAAAAVPAVALYLALGRRRPRS